MLSRYHTPPAPPAAKPDPWKNYYQAPGAYNSQTKAGDRWCFSDRDSVEQARMAQSRADQRERNR